MDVLVSAAETIILDEDVVLGTLTIDGTLIVLDRPEAALTAGAIMMPTGGMLAAGAAGFPYRGHLRITLAGTGTREILVEGASTLELLGLVEGAPWTKLAAHASAGAGTLTVVDPLVAAPGARIAVTPSDFHVYDTNDPLQALLNNGPVTSTELFTLPAGVNGNTLTLDGVLAGPRWGLVQNLPGGILLDERAEVALLTRHITIEGADDAEWTIGRRGAVVRSTGGAWLHLDGVEMRRVGRAGSATGYPIQVAMAAEIARCAIWESVRGCMFLGSAGATPITDNVCVGVEGHGIVLPPATAGKLLRGNLVSAVHNVRPEDVVAGEDHQVPGVGGGASAYFSQEPQTLFEGNVASDADGHGFWLSPASQVPMAPFDNNTAHSNGLNAVVLATFGAPLIGGGYAPFSAGAAVPVVLRGINAFKNRGGLRLFARLPVVENSVFSDSGSEHIERLAGRGIPGSVLRSSVFVGRSGNAATPADSAAAIGNSVFHSVEDNTFIGFPGPPFGVVSQAGVTWPHVDRYLARFVRNTLIDSVVAFRPPVRMPGLLQGPAFDPAGLVTGRPGSYWVIDEPFMKDSSCTPVLVGQYNNNVACDGPYGVLRAPLVTGANPSPFLGLRRIDLEDPEWASTLSGTFQDYILEQANGPEAYDAAFVVANPATSAYRVMIPGAETTGEGVTSINFQWSMDNVRYPASGGILLIMPFTPSASFTVQPSYAYPGAAASMPAVPMSSRASVLSPTDPGIWHFDGSFLYMKLYSWGLCQTDVACASAPEWQRQGSDTYEVEITVN